MKTVFLKVTGVTPDELASLHALYDDGRYQESGGAVRFKSPSLRDSVPSKALLVSIVSAKLDKDHPTYTVEIQVNAVIGDLFHANGLQQGIWELSASASVLNRIWQALKIFPEKEEFFRVRD